MLKLYKLLIGGEEGCHFFCMVLSLYIKKKPPDFLIFLSQKVFDRLFNKTMVEDCCIVYVCIGMVVGIGVSSYGSYILVSHRMVVGFIQSVHITTDVVHSNLDQCDKVG